MSLTTVSGSLFSCVTLRPYEACLLSFYVPLRVKTIEESLEPPFGILLVPNRG